MPVGNLLTVTEAIPWAAADIPAPGTTASSPRWARPTTRSPPLSALADFNAFVAFVRDHNNVTWRNFNVVDLQAMIVNPRPQPFIIGGAEKEDVEMGLEVIAYLPAEARLALEAPADLLQRFPKLELEGDGEYARATLRPLGRQDLGVAEFPAGMRARARLHVELPKEAAKQQRLERRDPPVRDGRPPRGRPGDAGRSPRPRSRKRNEGR